MLENSTKHDLPPKKCTSATSVARTGRIYENLDRLTDKAMIRLFSRCEHTDLKPHYLKLKKHFTTEISVKDLHAGIYT